MIPSRRLWPWAVVAAVVVLIVGLAVASARRAGRGGSPPGAEARASDTAGERAPPGPTEVAPSANGCVSCHEAQPQTSVGGHSVADWRRSRHATAGVTCDRCHGGDPAATTARAAHAGVRSSRDSQSRVYYTRIPATCGSCHTEELGFFDDSRHYEQLVTSGRGPNCVTCHGAMAIDILAAGELQETCAACHNRERGLSTVAPVSARYLLLLLQQVEYGLGTTERLVEEAGDRGRREAAAAELAQARTRMNAVRQAWHSFDLARIEAMLLEAASAAAAARARVATGGP